MKWLDSDTIYSLLYKKAEIDPQLAEAGLTEGDLLNIRPGDRTKDVMYGTGKTVLGVGRGSRNKYFVRGGKATVTMARMRERNRNFGQPSKELFDNTRLNMPNYQSDSEYVKHQMDKTAGLFLKPSDLGDHRNLAISLENALTDPNRGKVFNKEATSMSLINNTRLHGAIVGGVAGGATEVLRRQYSDPVPLPPPESPKGLVGKAKHIIHKNTAEADAMSRKHPVTSTLAAASVGAAVGAYMNPKGIKHVLTRHKLPTPRI
jgi:hypothetical protein